MSRNDSDLTRRLSRREKHASVADSSRTGYTQYTQYTQYTNETASQDIHTMLALSDFPAPPSSLPTPSTPNSAPSAWQTNNLSSRPKTTSIVSHNTTSTSQEEILQDHFIARLLGSAHPPNSAGSGGSGSPWNEENYNWGRTLAQPSGQDDSRLRFVPSSPTMSAHTHSTALPTLPPLEPPPPTPPVPPLPSPLMQAYFPPQSPYASSSHNLSSSHHQLTSESSHSKYSNQSSSVGRQSQGAHIVRVSSPPTHPLSPGSTTVVGYARAAYIPKTAAVSPPPPIIVPSVHSPTNLIDLRSPGPAALSPRQAGFPDYQHDTLSPLPSPALFARSVPLSPRNEAPPNVPEDVPPDDPGPSTSYFKGDRYKHRISMSSIFSKFSRSTSISSGKHGRYWTRTKQKDLPPLPPMPKAHVDPVELEKQERDMALPALVRRAGFLSNMLDSGRLPARTSVSTYHGFGGTPLPPASPHDGRTSEPTPSAPSGSGSGFHSASVNPSDTPPEGSPWEYTSGSGYVDELALRKRRSQSIKSFFTKGTTTDRSGHYNVLDEELQRRYMEQVANSSVHASSTSRYPASSGTASQHVTEGQYATHFANVSLGNDSEKRRVTILAQQPPRRPSRREILLTPALWKRRNVFAVILNIILVITVIGVVVGLTWKHHSSSAGSMPNYNCSGNFTGALCNLDATCQCTTPGAVCNPLANAIGNLIPQTNNLMGTSYTAQSVGLTMWDMMGSPAGGNCERQALLVDINPKGADTTHLQWAQSAVLWSVLQSEDEMGNENLRAFVTGLNFGQASNSSKFQMMSAGFVFDFLDMTITAPPITWRSSANPPQAQTSAISSALESVLDRFYTSSNALSAQATTALQNYWTKDLNLDYSLLPDFIAAFQSSPVLMPFDMTLDSNNNSLVTVMQLNKPKSISFPPSLACNPMMTAQQLQAVNSIETAAFGLSQISKVPSTFDTSCFANRPTYGVLDVLRTRLPYADGVPQVPLQAAVLANDPGSRLLVRLGEAVSSYPSSSATSLPSSALSPQNYGTVPHMDHVMLAFLKALPLSQAPAIATFIAGEPTVPPPASTLGSNSSAIPVVEVALLGSIGPTDIDHSVSSFSTPSGSLFFGSGQGSVFRAWANSTATTSSVSIVWANSSTAATVVNDNMADDQTYDEVWSAASIIISNANTVGNPTGPSDVATVLGHLQQLGFFTSS